MAEPQLSVRSARARDLAPLEAYETREAGREPASAFYTRLSKDYGTDIHL